jgi:hypothetical protein
MMGPRRSRAKATLPVRLIRAGVLLGILGLLIMRFLPQAIPALLKAPAGSKYPEWQEADKPLIAIGDTIPRMLWNDPSVLKVGNDYVMWLSGGDLGNLKRIEVKVYRARSSDGKAWTIDPAPVLAGGPDPTAWDSLRTETPSVVKVGSIYHLYYSGFSEHGADIGHSDIGHATSQDGVHWTKDPANPVLAGQKSDKFRWGYQGVGEPAIVYNPNDQTFYLYHGGMRFLREQPSVGQLGIILATSKDGSSFSYYKDKDGGPALTLIREVPNAPNGAWYGYTGPGGAIGPDGKTHLMCTFIVAPKGQRSARQVTLDHAVSSDGIHFQVIEQNVFEAAKGDWKDHQVRSPSILFDKGKLEMWFAGETKHPVFGSFIGYASRKGY